ncbi:MAG TPA: hypothetical protein VF950_12340 [Planctomycetota bacterium]
MRVKEWAAVAALTFGVLGMALALESHVTGVNAFLDRPEPAVAPTGVEAFRKTLSLTLDAGARRAESSFDIPRGKRLILEFATANVAGTGVSARLRTQGSGEDILDHRLGLATGDKPGTLQAAQPLRAFADAGTRVTVEVERPRFGETTAAVATLFGYLIDVP